MKYAIGVYGDSISFGYGNNDTSWFDRLSGFDNKLKLSQNGETICNVLNKISFHTNSYQTLIIAVGINDFFQDSPLIDTSTITDKIAQYEQILKIAKKISSKIVVQSLLPVIEDRFPNQKYLDEPKWLFNINAIEFNKLLLPLARKYNAQFIDSFKIFNQKDLTELYFDGVHPNKYGQDLLLKIYTDELNK